MRFPRDTLDSVHLTKREKTLLSLVLRGNSYKMVAAAMGIRESSARNLAYGVIRDLRLPGKVGLVTWAMCHPEVFTSDEPIGLAMHPPGCACGSPYCRVIGETMTDVRQRPWMLDAADFPAADADLLARNLAALLLRRLDEASRSMVRLNPRLHLHFPAALPAAPQDREITGMLQRYGTWRAEQIRFLALVERERCAKIAEEYAREAAGKGEALAEDVARSIAARIRLVPGG